MKIFLVTLTLSLVSFVAQAGDLIPLKPGELNIYTSADFKMLKVEPTTTKCLPGAPCEPMSIVHISVGLGGCMDRLLGHNFVTGILSQNGISKKVIYITAIAAFNEASKQTRCVVQNRQTIGIALSLGAIAPENIVILPTTSANTVKSRGF